MACVAGSIKATGNFEAATVRDSLRSFIVIFYEDQRGCSRLLAPRNRKRRWNFEDSKFEEGLLDWGELL